MVHYRIQKRKFSANIIEKGVEVDGKISWSPYLGIFHSKKEADSTTEKVMEFLKTL